MDSSLYPQFDGKTRIMLVYPHVQLCSVWGPVGNFQSRSIIASVSLCSMNVKLM